MSHKKLEVYDKAMDVLIKIHKLLDSLSGEERKELYDMVILKGVELCKNIDMGSYSESPEKFLEYLDFAKGNLAALDAHLEIMRVIYSLDTQSIRENELVIISKMLYRLMESVKLKMSTSS